MSQGDKYSEDIQILPNNKNFPYLTLALFGGC